MSITLNTSIAIAAPADKVWEALTSPEWVKQYFYGTELDTDWQVGSPIFFRGEWEGNAYEDKGTVLAFDPPRSLRYNYWSSWSAKPDVPENYNNIEYMVQDQDGMSIVTITQDGFEDEEKRDHSEKNWQMIIGAMKELLEK